ncbi:MAG: yneA [Pseudonocardiales bacterium]|nr:yneA [Pseudonocardiales bacterium]
MSVAPDIAPEVLIPARARRTARDTRGARLVTGNVITPTAFHLIDLEPNRGDARGLRLVAPRPVSVEEANRLRQGVPVRSAATGVRSTRVTDPRSSAGVVRLTARGRLAFALAAVVVALGISIGAWFGAAGAGDAPAATAVPAQVVVHDGDTLWSIATAVAPGRDPRVTVENLRRINGLGSADLAAGQVLRLH